MGTEVCDEFDRLLSAAAAAMVAEDRVRDRPYGRNIKAGLEERDTAKSAVLARHAELKRHVTSRDLCRNNPRPLETANSDPTFGQFQRLRAPRAARVPG
jgi:hypothetical protein